MKVLVVEDNIELSKNLESYLSKEGSICETAFTYNQAIDKIISDILQNPLMRRRQLSLRPATSASQRKLSFQRDHTSHNCWPA